MTSDTQKLATKSKVKKESTKVRAKKVIAPVADLSVMDVKPGDSAEVLVKQASPRTANVKSILKEGDDIIMASTMIALGARLQVLEQETGLSYDRLSRLYREIRGCSAPKGMLPFSVDWFMSWRPNVHSSVFYSIYRYLEENTPSKGTTALIQAYTLYLEHEHAQDGSDEPVLSFTRAWMLLRFMNIGNIQMTPCTECHNELVTHANEIEETFVCSVCRPPARIVGMLAKEERLERARRAGLIPSFQPEDMSEGSYFGKLIAA